MAGYFSNHSQSRFLANSSSTTTTTTTTTTTATTTTPAGSTASSQNISSQPTTTRPRAPSSKHFSTFVSTSDDKSSSSPKTGSPATNGTPAVHPLRNTYVYFYRILSRWLLLAFSSWVFWFRQQHTPGSKITNYEEGIKRISAFGSVITIPGACLFAHGL